MFEEVMCPGAKLCEMRLDRWIRELHGGLERFSAREPAVLASMPLLVREVRGEEMGPGRDVGKDRCESNGNDDHAGRNGERGYPPRCRCKDNEPERKRRKSGAGKRE